MRISSPSNLRASRMARVLTGSSMGVLLALAVGAPQAMAQDAPSEEVEAVVITGSLFRNPNYVSASPISATTSEEIKETGAVTIEAALNQNPQFTPSGTSGNGGQGTGGQATVNLRGLGANRNLVLLDGRRLPAANISGSVDINLVPDSILEGVDVISGGASAVYGSDAMSGVVNFRTLRKFEGVRVDLQYGNSFENDYAQYSGSVAMGGAFGEDDKGHILLSLGFTNRDGLRGSARPFFTLVTPSSFIGQGTFVPSATNAPNQVVLNNLFTSYGAATPVSNTLNLGFNNDGTLFTQTGAKNYKGPTTDGYAIIAGNVRMPVGPQTYIQNPIERKNLYSKFDYDLTSSLNAYGQVLYVDSTVYTSSGNSLTQFGTLTTIPVSNPFIPTDLRTLLASRPTPGAAFTWNGRYVGLPAKAWDEQYTTSQFLLGLRGDLPFQDWSWNAFASYDATDHTQKNYHAVLKSRVQTLLNAADGGNSICAGGFNPFGLAKSSVISDACENYMTTTAISTERLTQTLYQADVQGPIFELPAGPVNVALLASTRKNSYVYRPDADLAAQNIEAVVASQASKGSVTVVDYAAQFDIPILADLPGVHKLNLGAAYRYSDYDTTGGVSSYEGDVKYWPVESLLLRAGYQRAVRAPNIGELFSAASGSQIAFGTPPASIGDPCDVRSTARTGAGGSSVRTLCLAQGIPTSVIDSYQFPTTATAGLSSGNPNLKPESADTFNVGAVWNSPLEGRFTKGLTASVDYWNISIKDVISVVPGLTALAKCYNLDGSNPGYAVSNQFCALLSRDAQGLLQTISTPYLNLGGLKTDGVDAEVNWRLDMEDFGVTFVDQIFASTGIAYTNSYQVQTLPNTPFVEQVGTNTIVSANAGPHPTWKALTTVGFTKGGLTASMRWRYLDAMKDITAVTTPAAPGRPVPVYNLFDVVGSYNFGDGKYQVRAGVTNVLDEDLPVVASSQTSTDTSTYDAVGRSFYVGLRVNF